MSNKAVLDSFGNEFSVRFGLDDLSGRAKASLFRSLLIAGGVMDEIVAGSGAEALLTKAMNNLWEQK